MEGQEDIKDVHDEELENSGVLEDALKLKSNAEVSVGINSTEPILNEGDYVVFFNSRESNTKTFVTFEGYWS